MTTSILVVSDDRSARNALGLFFAWAGYEVEVCPDGSDALRRLREQPYSLLISRDELPSTNGVELVRAACALRQSLRCIVISKHACPPIEAAPTATWLSEPVDLDQLLALLREEEEEARAPSRRSAPQPGRC